MGNNVHIVPNQEYLRRLKVFIDVFYAIVFFEMLKYLPPPENMEWTKLPYGLLSLLIDHRIELLRIFIGAGLALIMWNQNNNLFKSLVKTNGFHAMLSLLQIVFVSLFIYFAISDPALVGGPSSPALQSASLAIAGFIGVWAWLYAKKHRFVDENLTEDDLGKVTKQNLREPLTASLTIPLSFIGPMVWTIGWFTLPILVIWVLKLFWKKK
jgi:uncharacterized membrane protein